MFCFAQHDTRHDMHDDGVKRPFRVFELSKSEQRVVLIVIFILIALAFVRYERRLHRFPVQSSSATESSPSATPATIQTDR